MQMQWCHIPIIETGDRPMTDQIINQLADLRCAFERIEKDAKEMKARIDATRERTVAEIDGLISLVTNAK
jgi:hypothetical protein